MLLLVVFFLKSLLLGVPFFYRRWRAATACRPRAAVLRDAGAGVAFGGRRRSSPPPPPRRRRRPAIVPRPLSPTPQMRMLFSLSKSNPTPHPLPIKLHRGLLSLGMPSICLCRPHRMDATRWATQLSFRTIVCGGANSTKKKTRTHSVSVDWI